MMTREMHEPSGLSQPMRIRLWVMSYILAAFLGGLLFSSKMNESENREDLHQCEVRLDQAQQYERDTLYAAIHGLADGLKTDVQQSLQRIEDSDVTGLAATMHQVIGDIKNE